MSFYSPSFVGGTVTFVRNHVRNMIKHFGDMEYVVYRTDIGGAWTHPRVEMRYLRSSMNSLSDN